MRFLTSSEGPLVANIKATASMEFSSAQQSNPPIWPDSSSPNMSSSIPDAPSQLLCGSQLASLKSWGLSGSSGSLLLSSPASSWNAVFNATTSSSQPAFTTTSGSSPSLFSSPLMLSAAQTVLQSPVLRAPAPFHSMGTRGVFGRLPTLGEDSEEDAHGSSSSSNDSRPKLRRSLSRNAVLRGHHRMWSCTPPKKLRVRKRVVSHSRSGSSRLLSTAPAFSNSSTGGGPSSTRRGGPPPVEELENAPARPSDFSKIELSPSGGQSTEHVPEEQFGDSPMPLLRRKKKCAGFTDRKPSSRESRPDHPKKQGSAQNCSLRGGQNCSLTSSLAAMVVQSRATTLGTREESGILRTKKLRNRFPKNAGSTNGFCVIRSKSVGSPLKARRSPLRRHNSWPAKSFVWSGRKRRGGRWALRGSRKKLLSSLVKASVASERQELRKEDVAEKTSSKPSEEAALLPPQTASTKFLSGSVVQGRPWPPYNPGAERRCKNFLPRPAKDEAPEDVFELEAAPYSSSDAKGPALQLETAPFSSSERIVQKEGASRFLLEHNKNPGPLFELCYNTHFSAVGQESGGGSTGGSGGGGSSSVLETISSLPAKKSSARQQEPSRNQPKCEKVYFRAQQRASSLTPPGSPQLLENSHKRAQSEDRSSPDHDTKHDKQSSQHPTIETTANVTAGNSTTTALSNASTDCRPTAEAPRRKKPKNGFLSSSDERRTVFPVVPTTLTPQDHASVGQTTCLRASRSRNRRPARHADTSAPATVAADTSAGTTTIADEQEQALRRTSSSSIAGLSSISNLSAELFSDPSMVTGEEFASLLRESSGGKSDMLLHRMLLTMRGEIEQKLERKRRRRASRSLSNASNCSSYTTDGSSISSAASSRVSSVSQSRGGPPGAGVGGGHPRKSSRESLVPRPSREPPKAEVVGRNGGGADQSEHKQSSRAVVMSTVVLGSRNSGDKKAADSTTAAVDEDPPAPRQQSTRIPSGEDGCKHPSAASAGPPPAKTAVRRNHLKMQGHRFQMDRSSCTMTDGAGVASEHDISEAPATPPERCSLTSLKTTWKPRSPALEQEQLPQLRREQFCRSSCSAVDSRRGRVSVDPRLTSSVAEQADHLRVGPKLCVFSKKFLRSFGRKTYVASRYRCSRGNEWRSRLCGRIVCRCSEQRHRSSPSTSPVPRLRARGCPWSIFRAKR